MDLTLLISALIFFGLIGIVTAAYKTGDEPSFMSQSGGSKKIYKSGKILFLTFLFLAVIFIQYITNMF